MPPKMVITPEHDASHPHSLVPTDSQELILRAIVSSVLASRRSIYTTPGLEDVAGNGGSRINQRVQQMLKKLCAAYKAEGIVAEEVANASGKRAPPYPAAGGEDAATGAKQRGKVTMVIQEDEESKVERITTAEEDADVAWVGGH